MSEADSKKADEQTAPATTTTTTTTATDSPATAPAATTTTTTTTGEAPASTGEGDAATTTTATGEKKKVPASMAQGLDGLSEKEARVAQAHLAAGQSKKQEVLYVANLKGETKELKDEVKTQHTVYVKACTGCTIRILATCTKILIEDVTDCVVELKGRILTEVVEFWKANGSTLKVDTSVKTLQIDLSDNCVIEYAEAENLGSIVWASVPNSLVIKHPGGEHATSMAHQSSRYPDLNPKLDQFIIRWNKKNKLREEMVVRLENGFPTTEREAQAFDDQQKKNDEAYENYVRKLMKFRGGPETLGLGKADKKVNRNQPCPCGSGKKYKKCCANKAAPTGADGAPSSSSSSSSPATKKGGNKK